MAVSAGQGERSARAARADVAGPGSGDCQVYGFARIASFSKHRADPASCLPQSCLWRRGGCAAGVSTMALHIIGLVKRLPEAEQQEIRAALARSRSAPPHWQMASTPAPAGRFFLESERHPKRRSCFQNPGGHRGGAAPDARPAGAPVRLSHVSARHEHPERVDAPARMAVAAEVVHPEHRLRHGRGNWIRLLTQR